MTNDIKQQIISDRMVYNYYKTESVKKYNEERVERDYDLKRAKMKQKEMKHANTKNA